MPSRKLFLILFFLPAFLFFTTEARPEAPTGELFTGEAPVEVNADKIIYDRTTDTYHATGNVEISQPGIVLRAESAIMDMAAGVATASGGINVVDEGGSTLTGESLQFNLKNKTAILANGRLFYRDDNIHLTADTFEKTGPESYKAAKLSYTTCDCPPDESPAWSFAASSAKVVVGDFLTGWNARFYIKGVPVMYSPYISIPIKRERQTGFLQPKPGYSRLRGFVLDNSFFWAISGNTDATFYLDVETQRGLGKGIEYRYIRTRQSYGQILFYQYQENDINRVRDFRDDLSNLSRPVDADNNRWRLKYHHQEELPYGVKLRADIDLVSDDEYFIDFGRGSNERSLESIESNVSASKSWSVFSLVGQFRLFNNLLDLEDATTLQRLPEITFTNTEKKIFGSPFYIASESSFVNFWRKEGVKGQRIDAHPRVSLPMSPGGWFDFTPSIGGRATYWLVDNHPDGTSFERFIYDATADLTTTFVRIYAVDMPRVKALRHTFRPGLRYTYIPDVGQSDLPEFDALDRIAAQNSMTYSINSTITGKLVEGAGTRYFDYLYLDLRQSYNIHEAQRELLSPTDERKPFSDITGEVIARPSEWIWGTAKGSFDVYDNRFNTYDLSVSAADTRGDTMNVTHRYVREGANYLEAALRARLSKGLDLTYLKRYSFDENRSLETAYGVEYLHQCWSSTLTYTERLEERIVYLTFDLLGLGRVAGIQGRIEAR
ncbi:MAG: LPS-assembly protein LptD [Deltaproteobacteria bacterium]|nr:LPS-assembly protein LptD [Deltaproteobacteria bacterium]